MDFDNDILTYAEKIVFDMRTLYSHAGYVPYKMSRFEEYELYAANRAFLPDGDIVAFTGANGKLMALRPDVTLSIVKSIKDDKELKKLYYNENVYRSSGGELKEQMQVGLECIGEIDTAQAAQVILLAKQSLAMLGDLLGGATKLDISHMGIPNALIQSESGAEKYAADILRCVGEKNKCELERLCKSAGCSNSLFEKLAALTSLSGPLKDIKPELELLNINSAANAALKELTELGDALAILGISDGINIDFSVINDINYYNSIVFQGYIEGVPEKVIAGGRYDELLRSFGKSGGAVGFAVYLDLVSAFAEDTGKHREVSDTAMLGVALPKGRLGQQAYELFEKAGFDCPDISLEHRKLVFENPQAGIRYFWVKPSDVAAYVERGIADVGIVGKDTLLETPYDVYELLDLGIGKCRVCVAGKSGISGENHERALRVATKFPNIAREYYAGCGRDIDIIKLHGSIELAPLLGLSDVIVDLVETGRTLSENNLETTETVAEISARLIANKAGYKFKHNQIQKLCKAVEQQI